MSERTSTDGAEVRALRARVAALEQDLERLRTSESSLAALLSHEEQRGVTSAVMFRRLVESVRDYAIFMLDARGHVASWNVGASRIKGYAASEIIGRHFSIFYPKVDVEAGKCEMELEVAAREGRFEDEGWRVRKDGNQFWANVVISAIRDDQGILLGFSKVTRDLTLRKQAEEEQAARRAAEEANRVKDEFLAMLGHELRNPLAPITTALQLLSMRSDYRVSKEQQIIERQVKHMTHLVDDLLDVSRVTRGSLVLKRQPQDLRDVLAKALEVASTVLEQRSHRVEIDVPDGRVAVLGDEARLVQIFANILVNAAKYTEPRGHIWVTMSRDEAQVSVTIRDDGNGISPELLPRVFELFVRGYVGPEHSAGGLGLGLTLVRRLVEMHDGSVAAESPGLGLGSTFTVRLPLVVSTLTDQAPASARLNGHRASKALRILVVDDNEDAAMLLAEVLSGVGHQVKTGGDAFAALKLAQEFRPEVAILDIGLPVMDGHALAARLRAELGANTPRLIAVTGYGQRNDRERSAAAGFDAHLVKPIDVQQLLALLEESESVPSLV